jgi:hypothetical protein
MFLRQCTAAHAMYGHCVGRLALTSLKALRRSSRDRVIVESVKLLLNARGVFDMMLVLVRLLGRRRITMRVSPCIPRRAGVFAAKMGSVGSY